TMFDEARQALQEYEKESMAEIRQAFDDAYRVLSTLEGDHKTGERPQTKRDILRDKVEQLKERYASLKCDACAENGTECSWSMLPESFLCDTCERTSNRRIGCSIDGEPSTERKREWHLYSRQGGGLTRATPAKRRLSDIGSSENEIGRAPKPKKRVRIEEENENKNISKEAADLLVATFEKLFEHWSDKKTHHQ
ncbi:10262_t:CDS:2, partial [Acaulospora colombiana]